MIVDYTSGSKLLIVETRVAILNVCEHSEE